ncbi:unnamed protein product [Rodentolepis nana]|uniref:Uncharacterized protein n=1 Tax=Rodentolepis nana TaxID=102285 RepID=A0A3P7TLX6_RODNA|nr:unnamed protein product [Rodentolepis nana]
MPRPMRARMMDDFERTSENALCVSTSPRHPPPPTMMIKR